MKSKPLGKRVLISAEEMQEKTQGGIIIPDAAKQKVPRGYVIAVGPNVETVKVKDLVLYTQYSGNEIELDGVKYIIMSEDEILLVVGK